MSRDLKLKLLFAMTEKATEPMRKVAIGAGAMGRELIDSRKQLRDLHRTQADIGSFRKLHDTLNQTQREWKESQDQVRALAQEIGETDNPTRTMTRAFEKAKREAGDLKNRFQEQQTELQGLRGSLRGAGISTDDLAADQIGLKQKIAITNQEIEQQQAGLDQLAKRKVGIGQAQQTGAQVQSVGFAAVGAGLALGAPIVVASQEAITLEGRLVDVRKVLDNIDDAGMARLKSGLIDMSEQIPLAVEGLGEIAAEGARAGVVADDLLPFTRNAAKMAASFDIAAGEAGSMMSQWQKGLDLTIPQTVELGDKINALTNKFGGSAPAVAEMVTLVGPLGKVAGVASGEMAAMSQLMNAIGVDSRVGATGIKNFMLTLSAGEGASQKQAAAFKQLGFDAVEMSQRMQVDARGAITDVMDAIAALPKAQQSGLLTNLFGRESVAAIAPMLSSLDKLKSNFSLVGDNQSYAGSMSEEFQVAMSKTENQLTTAKNAIGGVGLELGGQLIPVIQMGAGWIKTIGSSVAGWMREHPGLTKAIGLTVAIIASLLVVLGTLAIGLGALIAPFAMLRYGIALTRIQFGLFSTSIKAVPAKLTALQAGLFATATRLKMTGMAALTTGRNFLVATASMLKMAVVTPRLALTTMAAQLRLVGAAALTAGGGFAKAGLLFLASPIGLVIAGIALAAALIYTHWDTLKPYFAAIWSGITTIFSGVFTVIKALVMTFTPAGLIYKHWDSISAWFGALWEGTKSVFSGVFDWAASAFLNFTPFGLIFTHWDTLSPYFTSLWDGITGFLGGVWDVIGQMAEGNFNPANLIIEHWQGLTNWFSGLWNNISAAFGNAWSNLSATMSGWATSALNIGAQIISGLANGIISAPQAVFNALKNVVFGGVNRVKEWLGIRSPSRVFMGFGEQMMQGLSIGLDRSAGGPLDRLNRFGQSLTRVAIGSTASLALAGAANASISGQAPPSFAPRGQSALARPIAANSDKQVSIVNYNSFKIVQQPGEDAEAFARRVAQMIRENERQDEDSAYNDDV